MLPNKFSIHVITDLLWYRIFDGLDLAEELMWRIVIERKLSIEHCVQQHSKSPHVTWLAVIKPACNITTTTSLCSASSMTLPAFAADRYVPAMGCSAANLLDATADGQTEGRMLNHFIYPAVHTMRAVSIMITTTTTTTTPV